MSILDGSPDMFLGVAGLIITIVIIALLASIVLFIKRRFSSKKQVCPTCGAQIDKGKQCPNCSVKNVAYSPQNQPACPACSASLGPSEKFCHQCGARIEETSSKPVSPPQSDPSNKPAKKPRSYLIPILRILSGLLILSGLFLPFYNQGTTSLGSLLLNFISGISMTQSYPAPLVFLVFTALLILLGGIASLTKGIGGALITLFGLSFAVLSLNFIFGELLWLKWMGIGFYLPILGLVLNLVSSVLGHFRRGR